MRTFDELVLIRVRPYGLFEVRDVKGDGNCFYSALALSDELNVKCQEELRHLLNEKVAELPLARSLYKRFAKNNTSFDAWVEKVKQSRSWAGELEAVFVCLLFNINVCLVTNSLKGFYIVDVRKWLTVEGENFIDADAPTVFLYHHVYKRPTTKSVSCNHFALLEPYERNVDGVTIYENTNCDI